MSAIFLIAIQDITWGHIYLKLFPGNTNENFENIIFMRYLLSIIYMQRL